MRSASASDKTEDRVAQSVRTELRLRTRSRRPRSPPRPSGTHRSRTVDGPMSVNRSSPARSEPHTPPWMRWQCRSEWPTPSQCSPPTPCATPWRARGMPLPLPPRAKPLRRPAQRSGVREPREGGACWAHLCLRPGHRVLKADARDRERPGRGVLSTHRGPQERDGVHRVLDSGLHAVRPTMA